MISNIIIAIISGAPLGYLTSVRTPSDGLEDLTRNILVGIGGAFIGLQSARGFLGSDGAGPSVFALGAAGIAGALVILFIVNRVRRA